MYNYNKYEMLEQLIRAPETSLSAGKKSEFLLVVNGFGAPNFT